MINRIKQILTIAVCLLTIMPAIGATAPKREFRCSWISTVWALDWPKDDNGEAIQGNSASVIAKQKEALVKMLDSMKNDGFNAAFFQVRSMSDAMYKSSYEPWSSYLTGSRGTDAGWDPLEFAVEEAHKRGIELHAWLNPYRWSSGTSWNTDFDKKLQSDGWLLQSEKLIYMNPGLKAVEEHLLKVTREIVTNYDVDGIVFDDYFYPNGLPENSSAPDYDLWKSSGTTLSFGNWRRDNINRMVRAVSDMIHSVKPSARFGIGPAGVASKGAADAGITPCKYGSDWQYDDIYSDPIAWVHQGSVDYISPQIYWSTTHSTNPFGPLTKWWSETANHFNRHHYASHSISSLASNNSESAWSEFAEQIKLSRQYTLNNAPGCVFFRQAFISGPLASGFGNYLKNNVFTAPALAPAMTWKSRIEYDKVKNLTKAAAQLSWDKEEGTLVKYTVYAVPLTVSYDDALNANGDGLKNDYLLGISYTGSYTVPESMVDNYWYAVCVYDGYGNEFSPATINLSSEESEAPKLITPVDNAVADWNPTFSWSTVANATYEWQLSDRADFKRVIMYTPSLTANTLAVDLSALESDKAYYWRVKCRQTGKLETISLIGAFRTKVKEAAPVAELITPADNEQIADNFSFVWNPNGAEKSTLQVSASQSFETIKLSDNGTPNGSYLKTDINLATLGKGTFYWRVLTDGKINKQSASEVRSFTITVVPTGEYEEGYSVKKDPAKYEKSPASHTIKSLWMRSVKSDFANFKQANDGAMNRGFVISGGFVYIVGRQSASSTSETYLAKYDLTTGELIGKLMLSEEASANFLPANDVLTDSEGNVCISNLTINAATSPLKVQQVNLETGALRTVAEVNTDERARIDYCAAYGNVATGNFSLFAAVASGKKVYRWKFVNGSLTATETATVSEFIPASASNFGIAARIIPIDESSVFVSGGSTSLVRYSFPDGKITDSFASNQSMAPTSYRANGADFFTFDNVNYLVYPVSDYTEAAGFRFSIASTDATHSLATAQTTGWTIPENGLGNIDSQTWYANAKHAILADGRMVVVIYVPGNGLAAYCIEQGTGGIDTATENELSFTHFGNRISFSEEVASVEIYAMTGALVASYRNTDCAYIDLNGGAYIVKAVTGTGKSLSKVIIVR